MILFFCSEAIQFPSLRQVHLQYWDKLTFSKCLASINKFHAYASKQHNSQLPGVTGKSIFSSETGSFNLANIHMNRMATQSQAGQSSRKGFVVKGF